MGTAKATESAISWHLTVGNFGAIALASDIQPNFLKPDFGFRSKNQRHLVPSPIVFMALASALLGLFGHGEQALFGYNRRSPRSMEVSASATAARICARRRSRPQSSNASRTAFSVLSTRPSLMGLANKSLWIGTKIDSHKPKRRCCLVANQACLGTEAAAGVQLPTLAGAGKSPL